VVEAGSGRPRNGRVHSSRWSVYAASVFAQQAAEKAVKAVYIERRQQIPPRTHDLGLFAAELAVPAAVENDLVTLNPTFGLARYPDSAGTAPVDAIEAEDA
jgi:HEPN domain-containing protein